MISFIQHASGSKANMYEVQSLSGRLLIDFGLAWKPTLKALSYDLSGIEGALLGHAHGDHSKSLCKIVESGIDVYATQETFDMLPSVSRPRRLKVIKPGEQFNVGPFNVTPFSVYHDTPGACGFVIEQGNECILFVTDTATIAEDWRESGTQFNIIAIEASWNRARIDAGLEAGTINSFYANRLKTTHMEDTETKRYLRDYCDLSKVRELHLIHMSSTMDKQAVKAEFEDEFMLPVFVK